MELAHKEEQIEDKMNDIDTLTLEINNKVAELEQLRQDIVKTQNEEAQ